MMVRTYLKKHPEIKEFWLESALAFDLFQVDSFSLSGILGSAKIKLIEEVPDEPVTLHI